MQVLCRLVHESKAFRLKQAYFDTPCLISPGLLEEAFLPEYSVIPKHLIYVTSITAYLFQL